MSTKYEPIIQLEVLAHSIITRLIDRERKNGNLGKKDREIGEFARLIYKYQKIICCIMDANREVLQNIQAECKQIVDKIEEKKETLSEIDARDREVLSLVDSISITAAYGLYRLEDTYERYEWK